MEVTVCPGKEYYDLYPGYYEEEELPRPRAAVLKNTNIEAELLSQRRQGEATGHRRVHYSVQDQEDIEYAAYHRWGPVTLPGFDSFILTSLLAFERCDVRLLAKPFSSIHCIYPSRYQSPSPGPRQRHHHPGDRHHRSRRTFR